MAGGGKQALVKQAQVCHIYGMEVGTASIDRPPPCDCASSIKTPPPDPYPPQTTHIQAALDAGDYAQVLSLLPDDPATHPAPYPLLICYGIAATHAGKPEVRADRIA